MVLIRGRVLDAATGLPIQNAEIYIYDTAGISNYANYKYKIGVDPRGVFSKYYIEIGSANSVSVTAPGYNRYTANAGIFNSEDFQIKLRRTDEAIKPVSDLPVAPSANYWTKKDNDPNMKYWAWGYVIKHPEKTPWPYPRIRVFTPDGQLIKSDEGQEVYVGDGGGVWHMALPAWNYILEISDSFGPDRKMRIYRNSAHIVSNGYHMALDTDPLLVTPNTPADDTNPSTTTPIPQPEPGEDDELITELPQENDNSMWYILFGGAGIYFIGKQFRWWR